MTTKIISSGPLFAVVHRDEKRDANGLLANPPRIFVVTHDDQRDEVKTSPLAWEIAEALAPHDMTAIRAVLNLFRAKRALP